MTAEKEEDLQNPSDRAKFAYIFILTFRNFLLRRERFDPAAALFFVFKMALLAAIPFLLLIAVTKVVETPSNLALTTEQALLIEQLDTNDDELAKLDQQTLKPSSLSAEPAIDTKACVAALTSEDTSNAERLAACAAKPTDQQSAATIETFLKAQDSLETYRAEDVAQEVVENNTHYRARILMIIGWMLLAGFGLATVNAQARVIMRAWRGLVRAPQVQLVQHLPTWSPVALAVGFAVLFHWAAPWSTMPVTVDIQGNSTFSWIVSSTAALIFVAIYLTAFTCFSYARNWPSTTDADTLGQLADIFETTKGIRKQKDGKPDKEDTLSALLVEQNGEVPALFTEDGQTPKRLTEDQTKKVLAVLSDGNDLSRAVKLSPLPNSDSLRVNSRMSPEGGLIVVRSMSFALGILLVVSLVVAAGAIEYARFALDVPDTLQDAITQSRMAWLLILGFGYSVVLFLIYGLPTVWLKPYAEAAPKPASSSEDWTLSGDLDFGRWAQSRGHQKIELSLKRPDARADENKDVFEAFKKQLGADHTKFKTIMGAYRKGGGFHSMLEETLTAQLTRVLGLLSPAIASGLLALIG